MNKNHCTIAKLFREYDKAEYELIKRRDEEFPPGSFIQTEWGKYEVISGSHYPHQILTKMGHMGWRFIKKADQPGDRP